MCRINPSERAGYVLLKNCLCATDSAVVGEVKGFDLRRGVDSWFPLPVLPMIPLNPHFALKQMYLRRWLSLVMLKTLSPLAPPPQLGQICALVVSPSARPKASNLIWSVKL